MELLARMGMRNRDGASKPLVLVLGVYFVNRPSYARSIVDNLAGTSCYSVVQRWVSLGGIVTDERLRYVTCQQELGAVPKFYLINQLLERESLERYEYVIVVDDDIQLPERFLDKFLSLQATLEFRLAQPARTSNSFRGVSA